jgi:hypothetical protein
MAPESTEAAEGGPWAASRSFSGGREEPYETADLGSPASRLQRPFLENLRLLTAGFVVLSCLIEPSGRAHTDPAPCQAFEVRWLRRIEVMVVQG